MMLKRLASRLLMSAISLLPLLPAAAFADNGVPKEYRIKIDEIDTSKAPDITIRTTFLDPYAHPINPEDNVFFEIIANDKPLKVRPKATAFFKTDKPLDLAFVIPITERFSEDELAQIKQDFSAILQKGRDEDRFAGFFDDGRIVNQEPLGPAKAVDAKLQEVTPKTDASFLYSGIEYALDTLSDPANFRKNARRAIIIVTDAYDSYIYRKEDVEKTIRTLFDYATQNDIKIYVVMYKPLISSLAPLFEGLSRKTKGTFRYADSIEDISVNIENTWGEIYAQTFLEFRDSRLHKGSHVTYKIAVTKGSVNVESMPYAELEIQDVRFNWKLFFIVSGIVVGVLILLLIVFLIWRAHQKKLQEMEEAQQEQIIQEKIEKGEVCPKCRRTILKEWNGECMFCKREAVEEVNKAKAEQRQKAIEEAEKKGIKLEGRVCSVCGRTLMPQWKECLFCKAGIGGEGGPKAGVAPTRGGAKKKEEPPKGRVCPVCGKEMKAHWTTCLYCEADAANRPAPSTPKVEVKKNDQPAVRICPDCGKPMKPHWDVCLFCEANKSR